MGEQSADGTVRGTCSRARRSRWRGTSPKPTRSPTAGGWPRQCLSGRQGNRRLPAASRPGDRRAGGCSSPRHTTGYLISTDPPYYDNIGYSDLSDFFYVWLRRSLRDVHPDLLAHDARSEGGGAGSKPVPPRRQGRAQRSSSRTVSAVFARARETRARGLPDHRLLRVQAVRDPATTARRRRAGRHCWTG